MGKLLCEDIYGEYELVNELTKLLPKQFPYIHKVESFTKFNDSNIQNSKIHAFIQVVDTYDAAIAGQVEAVVMFVFAIKDNDGDYSLMKIGREFMKNISKINSNNILGIISNSVGEPRFEKDKTIWFRKFVTTVRYK
ncbi:MAG: hypothetical protein ACRCX2_01915 [Paraclostridium sp.]